jgi:hypothetical protein
LTDESELRKRDIKLHKRQSMLEYRNDTFDNVVEKYHIKCINLFPMDLAATASSKEERQTLL